MANNVFANGRELACKKGAGQTICAFPDVCMTPPENPATPPGIPVPYPNTGFAKDTTNGSKKVKITGKEVMLKNKSYFKTSVGDEAGCAAKKGVISSKNKGKVYFKMWSPDVKIEGANVVRHFDTTTHNHMCEAGNEAIPWPYMDTINPDTGKDDCENEKKDVEEKCKKPGAMKLHEYEYTKKDGTKGTGKRLQCSDDCKEARKCALVPKDKDKQYCCSPDTTGDHLIEANCFAPKGGRKNKETFPEFKGYDHEKAATACARPPSGNGSLSSKNNHNAMQAHREESKLAAMMGQMREHGAPMKTGAKGEEFHWTYAEARDAGAASHHKVNPHCSEACTKAQLDQYHKNDSNGPQCSDDMPVRTEPRSWNDSQFAGGREFISGQGGSYTSRV